jgi:hypothetical protein
MFPVRITRQATFFCRDSNEIGVLVFRSIHTASVRLHGRFPRSGARSLSLSGFAGRTQKSPASLGLRKVRETGEGSRTSYSLKETGLGSSTTPRTRFPSNIRTNLFLLTSHPNPKPYPRVRSRARSQTIYSHLCRLLFLRPYLRPPCLLCRRDLPAC